MRVHWLIRILVVLLLTSCEAEPERLDDYFLEFATVKWDGGECLFRLDNGRLLIPQSTDYTGKEGQRVVLSYTPLQGDTVKINRVSEIFTAPLLTEGFPNKLAKEPVKIQSIWVGGDYLNMIIETEYHSKPHKVALFQDTTSSTIDLHFSHSRESDPPGYPQVMYCSFLLESLRTKNEDFIPFRLFIHTYDGLREIPYTLN
ncbi:MAG: NigD-like C-terminal domain-containing protein [Proteiniphilum sp.]|nr:NigD-like C-terminal domain-containing protein [Proteiniphilum sp.]